MSGHRIEWTHLIGELHAKIICDEPADAICQFACAYCEEWNECDGAPTCHQRCGSHGDDETCSMCAHPEERHCWNGHTLLPRANCQIIDNVAMQGGAIETYGGPEGASVRDGAIRGWYDDGQWWEYA